MGLLEEFLTAVELSRAEHAAALGKYESSLHHIVARDPFIIDDVRSVYEEREAYLARRSGGRAILLRDACLDMGFMKAVNAYAADPLRRQDLEEAISACLATYREGAAT